MDRLFLLWFLTKLEQNDYSLWAFVVSYLMQEKDAYNFITFL